MRATGGFERQLLAHSVRGVGREGGKGKAFDDCDPIVIWLRMRMGSQSYLTGSGG